MCSLEVQSETCVCVRVWRGSWLSHLSLVFTMLFISYFGGGGNCMHCFGGRKEQLAHANLGRGAKDRHTWVSGGVNDFEICLSSCHCNGHSKNRQNVALHCQGFLHFWQHILNSSEGCVAARKGCMGQCEGRYWISHFMACLPKGKGERRW